MFWEVIACPDCLPRSCEKFTCLVSRSCPSLCLLLFWTATGSILTRLSRRMLCPEFSRYVALDFLAPSSWHVLVFSLLVLLLLASLFCSGPGEPRPVRLCSQELCGGLTVLFLIWLFLLSPSLFITTRLAISSPSSSLPPPPPPSDGHNGCMVILTVYF